MKTLLLSYISFCLGLLVFGSCGDGLAPTDRDNLPKIDTFDCPPLKYTIDELLVNPPSKVHSLQRVSPDGAEIAYVVNENIIKITNVTTGIVETYNPKGMMDSNVYFNGCFDLRWCPYDNNKLCFMFVTAIDTLGSGGRKKYGQNLFILYRKENRFNRIDLPYASKAGPESLSLYGWFSNSKLIDSFFIGYSTYTSIFTGIIVPQEKKVTTILDFNKLRYIGFVEDFSYSPDHQHTAALLQQVKVPPYGSIIYIDGVPLKFSDSTLHLLNRASWSPDGKKLAISLRLDEINIKNYETVWVIDVEKWLRERPAVVPVEKIDFQKRFCMYGFPTEGGIGAEFLNNKTLAVSCYYDGDLLCPLWEITTDGRLLRQITHDD